MRLKGLINETKGKINEAKKVKIPGKFSITYLGGKEFAFEQNEYGFEPTVSQAKKVSDALIQALNGLKQQLEITSMDKEASMYVRNEDVAVGLTFKSNMNKDDMDELVDGGIDFR